MSDSVITKKAIASAFKEVMKGKPFDKITINDIVKKCGLNRQTFYYHFEDRYDLMNWIYYNEIFLPLVENLNEQNYYLSFKLMFEKMDREKDFYHNALLMSAEYGFKEYMFSVLEELLKSIAHQNNVNLKFYTHGLLGIMVDWVKQGMLISPGEMANQIDEVLVMIKKRF